MIASDLLSDYVNDDDLAEAFGKSKRTIQRWRRQGVLPPARKIGNTNLSEVAVMRKVISDEAA
jgi:phage terminase Nu1 subunit (DNA packaging protein)